MIKYVLQLLWTLCCLALFVHCKGPSQVSVDEVPYASLSDYHFFTGVLQDLTPNTRIIPYDLNTPLFSDYAKKSRFVWIPEGKHAQALPDGSIAYPVGTVLIKNFFYPQDFQQPDLGREIIETRLIIRRENEWEPLTYVWNTEQTEAMLEIAGDVKDVRWLDEEGSSKELTYIIPNVNQCKTCHEYKKELQPLGPKVANLNKDYDYVWGIQNQLEAWSEQDILTGVVDVSKMAKMAVWDEERYPVSDRALAYLEVNCGSCHNEEGSAYISGLYLNTQETRPANLGFCKSPVSAGKGSGGRNYDIVPGDPEASILIYRMETDDPGARMPEIGRKLVHEEGVNLIREWIASLAGDCPESI
jgi:uncharacterized repeat protein (TIGR03806 family)